MSRLIPICIVIGIIFIGHISKRIDLSEIKKRKDFTSQYRKKLIGFLNDFLAGKPLNKLYPVEWTVALVRQHLRPRFVDIFKTATSPRSGQ